MVRLLELVIIMAACISPIFFWANEIDSDEYIKAVQGGIQAGVLAAVIAAYKIWSSTRFPPASRSK